MKLILVCQTEAAGPRLDSSSENPAQSATNRAGASAKEAARDLLDRFQLAAVYTSSAPPALETASVIADAAGLVPVVIDEPLPPEGAGIEDLISDDARMTALNAGEQLEEVQERAWRMIEMIRDATDAAATAVVVSDSIVIRAAVSRLLGLALADWRRFEIAPASITTLDFRPTRMILAGLNETCHLEGIA